MNNKGKIFSIVFLFALGLSLWGCGKQGNNNEIQKVIEINDSKTDANSTEGISDDKDENDSALDDNSTDITKDAEDNSEEGSDDNSDKSSNENADNNSDASKNNTDNKGTASSNSASKEESKKEKEPLRTEDGKLIIDLVFFAGQSNMSGCGGNYNYAPKVEEGHGYEFRAISDPTRLYNITEPFGINENTTNAIMDFPGQKNGSLVSAFANEYYELTGVPIVAVSASAGGTNTDFWLSQPVTYDLSERLKRAQVWLESNDYYIRKQYVLWLQGESDAIVGTTSEKYNDNMDNIIRPLFIGGVQKVFFITPGRTITRKNYFDDVINAQLYMGKNSGYYGVATTILSKVSTEYMVDEWHYNQSVLNLVGEEAAKSLAYYTLNQKEACLYDYFNKETYIPDGFGYSEDTNVDPIDVNDGGYLEKVPKAY